MARSALLNVMVQAALKAGKSLSRDFGEVQNLQVSVKGPGNFVTNADHKAEEILYQELARARHGYGFLMEERGIVEGIRNGSAQAGRSDGDTGADDREDQGIFSSRSAGFVVQEVLDESHGTVLTYLVRLTD